MDLKARDSYLKNSPDSRNFSKRIARIRQKGFHAETRPGEGNELDAAAVYIVNPGSNPIIGQRPWGDGTPTWVRDDTGNNSDKSFTVPAGKLWVLKAVQAVLASTATVGNRNLQMRVGDGVNDLWVARPPAVQAASLSKYYNFGDYRSESAFVGENLFNGYATVPELILPAGYTIRVYDGAAIDAAADDLTVVLHYVEYDA